ncbi:MAG: DNA gyrase subunit A [Deltaproteobacteria bacterium]|nr:DNA gyrase subunit A [Deltaproteobacteria bacterium]
MSDVGTQQPIVNIEEEVQAAYLDYSMSVIIGRALPDVRDGLKPVHRRILYAMFREGMLANRRYSKCAGVVGEVLKKYHPHGDSAVYDALVRMAQPWNMRHPLVDGQGNFGSVDGDAAAAYRYTECRLTRLAEQLLSDIDEETVVLGPNFDGSDEEPLVLPAAFPNLLVNGSDGIAVGMATKIPPHNLGETIDACIALLDDPETTVEGLMQHIPGPDFPTGATIFGHAGILEAYRTGKGRVVVRGRAEFEELEGGRQAIVIDELPFQVNKARLVEDIADLVKAKRIEGIFALRDESDRTGMRVVVELKRDAMGEIVLNQLFKHTLLQSTFGVILLAIVHGRPQTLDLKEVLQQYLSHRRVVITRRTQHRLRKARDRAHVLEGFRIALDHLDAVIRLIRASRTVEEAREGLQSTFGLTLTQAQAILDLKLQRLTGMEREKIETEYQAIKAEIQNLLAVLADSARLAAVIREELLQIRDAYAQPRRTRIVEDVGELSIEDLVAEEDQIITITRRGYIKRTSQAEYEVQRRGGMGRKAMETRDEDFVSNIFVANTHGCILAFTNRGRMYRLPVYALPEGGRAARGRPIVNLLPLQTDEEVKAVLAVRSMEGDEDLLFVSRRGLVKRTPLAAYVNVRATGILACEIEEGDELLMVRLAGPDTSVLLTTRDGMAIQFAGDQVRPMGRITRGVKGIDLDPDDRVVDAELIQADEIGTLLTVTSQGYGKRTAVGEYRLQNRAGKGLIAIRTGGRNGHVVGALFVREGDRVMLVTDTGRAIQMPVDGIRVVGRNTLGVRLMRVEEGERIVAFARVADPDIEDDTQEIVEE